MNKRYGTLEFKGFKGVGLTILVSFCLLATLAGCDSATAVVKDTKNQLEKKLKDATVLERSRVQLVDAQKSRAKLKGLADDFSIESEVALKQMKRLEEEKGKTVEAFKKLQDAARNAELPKLADATAEDKAKIIPIGSKTYTGEDVYRILREYKNQLKEAEGTIKSENMQSDFYKAQAEEIRSQLVRVNNNIADMERTIADYEMYVNLLKATKTIGSLGLSEDKMSDLLNTENVLAELRKGIDTAQAEIEATNRVNQGGKLKQELTGSPALSITDDDLL